MVIFLFPSMISLCAQKSWNSLEAFIFEIRENHYLDGARGIPCFSLHVSIGISELNRKRASLRTTKSVLLCAEGDKNTRFDGGG